MKAIFLIFISVIVLYSMYVDLKYGTLSPTTYAAEKKNTPAEKVEKKPFKLITVQPGDTLLSIEKEISSKQDIPLKKRIDDFKKYNNQLDPQDIQIGQTYKFPLYSEGS